MKSVNYWVDNNLGRLYRATKIELVNDPKKDDIMINNMNRLNNKPMINNLLIYFTLKVECDFSAAQWELYVNKFPRKEIENIADILNNRLRSLINDIFTKEGVRELMMEEMEGYSEYGAYDTEPLAFLDKVLDVIYFKSK